MCELWQYGLWSFQARGTKLERFLNKNQHAQRKLLNFEFWINSAIASCQKQGIILVIQKSKIDFIKKYQ